jgi:hypothetical protein
LRDKGQATFELFQEIDEVLIQAEQILVNNKSVYTLKKALFDTREMCQYILENDNQYYKFSHAKDILMTFGWLVSGWLSLNEIMVCHNKINIEKKEEVFYLNKMKGLESFILQNLPRCGALKKAIIGNQTLNHVEQILDLLSISH